MTARCARRTLSTSPMVDRPFPVDYILVTVVDMRNCACKRRRKAGSQADRFDFGRRRASVQFILSAGSKL